MEIPWYNRNAESALIIRDQAYRNWRANKTNTNWKIYTSLRNRAVVLDRNAHRSYSQRLLDARLDGKTLFKNLNKLGITDSTYDATFDNDFSSELFNRYFSESQTQLSSSCLSSFLPKNNCFDNLSLLDVLKAFYSIKSNATGSDGVTPKF